MRVGIPKPTTQDVAGSIRTPTPTGEKIEYTQPLDVFPEGQEPPPGLIDSDGLPSVSALEEMTRSPAGIESDNLPSVQDLEAIAAGHTRQNVANDLAQGNPELSKSSVKQFLSTNPQAASFMTSVAQRMMIAAAPNTERAKEVAQFMFGKDRVEEKDGELYVDGMQFDKDFTDSFTLKELPLDVVDFVTDLAFGMTTIIPEVVGATKGAAAGGAAGSFIPYFGAPLGATIGGASGFLAGSAAGAIVEDNARNAVLSLLTDERMNLEMPENLFLRTMINATAGKIIQGVGSTVVKGGKSLGKWLASKGLDKDLFIDAFDELAQNVLKMRSIDIVKKGGEPITDEAAISITKRFGNIIDEKKGKLGRIVSLFEHEANRILKGEKQPVDQFRFSLKELLKKGGGVKFENGEFGKAYVEQRGKHWMNVEGRKGDELQDFLVDMYNSMFKKTDTASGHIPGVWKYEGMSIPEMVSNLNLIWGRKEKNYSKQLNREIGTLYNTLANGRDLNVYYAIKSGNKSNLNPEILNTLDNKVSSTAIQKVFSNYSESVAIKEAFGAATTGRSDTLKHAIGSLVKRNNAEKLEKFKYIFGENSPEWAVFRAGWYTDMLEQSKLGDYSGRVNIKNLLKKIDDQLDPTTRDLMINKDELNALKVAGKVLNNLTPESLRHNPLGLRSLWMFISSPSASIRNFAETSAFKVKAIAELGKINAEYLDFMAETGLSQLAIEANDAIEKNMLLKAMNSLDELLGVTGAIRVPIRRSLPKAAQEFAEKTGEKAISKLPQEYYEVYRFTGEAAVLLDNLYTQDLSIQKGNGPANKSKMMLDYSILNTPLE